MPHTYRVYTRKQRPTTSLELLDPTALNWPQDYQPVCECQAPDLEAAFRALQHGIPECQMPPQEASFSVGDVLEAEDGTVNRCLGCGWERLT